MAGPPPRPHQRSHQVFHVPQKNSGSSLILEVKVKESKNSIYTIAKNLRGYEWFLKMVEQLHEGQRKRKCAGEASCSF